MWNIVHYIIGFMSEVGFITPEAAKALDRELAPKIISSNAEEAFKQVHDAFLKVEKDLKLKGNLVKVEPWLSELRLLETKTKTIADKVDLVAKAQIGSKGSDLTEVVKTLEARISDLENSIVMPAAKPKSPAKDTHLVG